MATTMDTIADQLSNTKESKDRRSTPIAPPDRKKYENDVSKISELIKEKEQQIGLVTVDGKNYGEELAQLGMEVESFEDRRGRIIAESKTIDEKLRQLGNEISKHKADSNRLVVGLKYMTEDKYDDQIRKLESELQSGRYSTKDEKKLRNEISSLEQAKAKVSDYQSARKSVDRCRAEQDRLRKHKDSLHRELKGLREKLTVAKDKMNKCRQDLDRVRERQREKKAQQDSISKEIHDLYNQRRQLNDKFRQHQAKYMEAMKNSTSSTADTSHVHKGHDERSTVRETRKKISRVSKMSVSSDQGGNTHEEEKSMCRTLITHFSRVMGGDQLLAVTMALESCKSPSSNSSLSPDNSPVSPSRTAVLANDSNGDYKVLPRKKETEEEWLPSSTKRRDSIRKDRKKSRKEKKATAKSQQKPLQLNPTIFTQFSKLGLQPPASIQDVPNTLEALKHKMSFLESSRLSVFATDSEAGDSGIMSSTGISEYSEYGINDLTSGEVTPNTISRNEMSPQPSGRTDEEEDNHKHGFSSLDGSNSCLDSTPMNSIKGLEHVQNLKTSADGSSACSDNSTPTSTPAEIIDALQTSLENHITEVEEN